jgi:hypothetical protein
MRWKAGRIPYISLLNRRTSSASFKGKKGIEVYYVIKINGLE